MSKFAKLFLVALVAVGISTPLKASAAELRPVQCSVTINYLVNRVVRAPFQKDFVVLPGTTFEYDFSSVIRFRYFTANTRLEGNRTVVSINYYNDVGVFDAIDFSTELVLHEDGVENSTSGKSTYFTSLGIAGDHTTDYILTCSRLKD